MSVDVGAAPTPTREVLEAKCRRRMALIAKMPSRGWDTQRERAELLMELDRLLDAWLAAP